jgi:hypothetical protein
LDGLDVNSKLDERLLSSLADAHHALAVGCDIEIYMSAGVYAYGNLELASSRDRHRVLGVNVNGKVETLWAIMRFAATLEKNSASQSRLIDIGSLHAIKSSPQRALYSSAKAFGLDLCAALLAGGEVASAKYVAVGPIDTPMLHRNHWLAKARGPESVVAFAEQAGPRFYRQLFVECSRDSLREASDACGIACSELDDCLQRYQSFREATRASPEGLLSSEEAARAIVDEIADKDRASGLYILFMGKDGAAVRHTSFEEAGRCQSLA